MENNQCYTTPLYKPHLYQPTNEPVTAAATSIMQNSNYLVVNNGPHMSNYTSSSILSSYPLASGSSYSAWQDAHPTDYLGLPTFDSKQETSPSASPLSSISSSSLDMSIHPSTEDFCVSDLLEPYAHQQQPMSYPALTDTTITTSTNYSTYFTQSSMQPPPQGISPNTEYWISPETPLMESMDGFMTTNPIGTMDYQHYHQQQQQQQQQQPYFFVKQKEDTVYMFDMGNSMNHDCITEPSSISLGSTKRKAKKVHRCPHCHHTSNRANNMKEHILTHDPYRPKLFACNICQKSFARKHDMKRHIKSHLRAPRKQSKSSSHPHYQV